MSSSADKLIRVNMSNQTVAIVDYPDSWELLGGRGLSAKILLSELANSGSNCRQRGLVEARSWLREDA